MASPLVIERRRFLRELAASLASGAALSSCRERGDGEGGQLFEPEFIGPEQLMHEVLRAYFAVDDLAGIAALGLALAGDAPVDPEAPLGSTERAYGIIQSTSSIEAAIEGLEQALEADFDQVRVTSLAGWQLAELEAELLGLAMATEL